MEHCVYLTKYRDIDIDISAIGYLANDYSR